jgi:hypothetical protein
MSTCFYVLRVRFGGKLVLSRENALHQAKGGKPGDSWLHAATNAMPSAIQLLTLMK